MSTALYVVGYIVVVAGLAWAASLLGVPETWIIVGLVVLAGLGIISLAGHMQHREPPPRRETRVREVTREQAPPTAPPRQEAPPAEPPRREPPAA
jgi:hypothetical protein